VQRVTRGLLIVVMALWLAVPLLQLGKVAQDGSAFVAAGRLGRSNLPAAYMTAHGLQPAFVKEACHLGV